MLGLRAASPLQTPPPVSRRLRETGENRCPRRLARLVHPNLVLIVVDTLRADFTSPYGFEQGTSPEIADRLRAMGYLE